MKKLVLIYCLVLLCFFGNHLFSENQTSVQLQPDTTAFEKRFKEIDQLMDYLKNRDVEYKELSALYAESADLLKEIKTAGENQDLNTMSKFLSYKLNVLEEKVKDKISITKSINIIYNLLVFFGVSIIVIMVIFSIVMYSRRK